MALSVSIRSRGYLPHWERANATYFVTFRLADSLPRELVERLRKERRFIERAERAGSSVAADSERARAISALLRRAERLLDSGLGECHMRNPRVAKIVADALLHFQGVRYDLFAWCVMPNHVHALFSPRGAHRIETILHTWKSYSAHKASALLTHPRNLWQREYFDHLVRNESSFWKLRNYIEENPRNAGLRNWPWVSSATCTAGVSPADSFPQQPTPTRNRRRDGGATWNAS